MTVYIDKDYKCYTAPADGLRAIETNFFNGKCKTFIEGHRFKPEGETWIREDGEVFSSGEMVTPHRDSVLLAAVQAQYDEMQEELNTAFSEKEQAEEVVKILLGEE